MVAAQDDQVTVEAGSGMTAAEAAAEPEAPVPTSAKPVVTATPTPQPAATPAAPAVAPKPVAQSSTNDKRWANWFSQQQSAPQSATKAGSSTYTVRSGDTLSVIARRHGVSMATLAQANNLTNPNALRIGQVLTIPSAAGSSAVAAPVISAPAPTAPAAPAAAPAAPVTAGGYYTVAKGDTLSGIARRHGTTIAKIMQANRMTTAQAHKLSIGQKIIIPNN
jgi:LysM repeat protein